METGSAALTGPALGAMLSPTWVNTNIRSNDVEIYNVSENLTVVSDNNAKLSDVFAMLVSNQCVVDDPQRVENNIKQSMGVLTSEE